MRRLLVIGLTKKSQKARKSTTNVETKDRAKLVALVS
jgi:hypothetical protein